MKKENSDNARLFELLETYEALFDAISDAIVLTDVERRIIRINKGVETMFGYSFHELKGKTTSILYESEDEYLRQGEIRFNLSAEEKKKPYEVNYRRKNGEVFPGETIGTVVKNANGDIIRYVGVIRDVTARKQAQEEINRLATTDQLTGLANRHQFEKRFNEYIKLAKREEKILGLLFLDLDKFKQVNDIHGHHAGDLVLQSAAKNIEKECRETDVVARLGGDEFAVLLVNSKTPQDIESVARRIIRNMEQPIHLPGARVTIEISIGISLYPDDSIDRDELIQMADLALYAAKNSERDSFAFYRIELATK